MRPPTQKALMVIFLALLSFCLTSIALAQNSTNTVVKAETSTTQPHIGETLTVEIKISNVQNLAGIDLSLQWNSSVLTLSKVALNLGIESHSNGVLHGSKLNYDYNTINSGEIYVQEAKVLGSYSLLAQSIGQTTPSFSGSGTIATLTFTATSTGPTRLALETELADHPPSGETANLIGHTDTEDTITVVIPEFQTLTAIVLIIILATTAAVFTKKLTKNSTWINLKS